MEIKLQPEIDRFGFVLEGPFSGGVSDFFTAFLSEQRCPPFFRGSIYHPIIDSVVCMGRYPTNLDHAYVVFSILRADIHMTKSSVWSDPL